MSALLVVTSRVAVAGNGPFDWRTRGHEIASGFDCCNAAPVVDRGRRAHRGRVARVGGPRLAPTAASSRCSPRVPTPCCRPCSRRRCCAWRSCACNTVSIPTRSAGSPRSPPGASNRTRSRRAWCARSWTRSTPSSPPSSAGTCPSIVCPVGVRGFRIGPRVRSGLGGRLLVARATAAGVVPRAPGPRSAQGRSLHV